MSPLRSSAAARRAMTLRTLSSIGSIAMSLEALAALQVRVAVGGGRQPLRRIHHDRVDEDARHPHLVGDEAAGRDPVPHLGEHDAAVVLHCLRGGEGLGQQSLAFHRDVAVLIRRRAADDRDVDREDGGEDPFLAGQGDQFDDVVDGGGVQPAAVDARVHEGAQPDVAHDTGAVRRGDAQQMGDGALRQAVRLDEVVRGEFLHALGPAPVPADDALDHADVGEPVDAVAVSRSPCPETCTTQSSRGDPLSRKRASSASRIAPGSLTPPPDPSTMTVAPSRMRSTASLAPRKRIFSSVFSTVRRSASRCRAPTVKLMSGDNGTAIACRKIVLAIGNRPY